MKRKANNASTEIVNRAAIAAGICPTGTISCILSSRNSTGYSFVKADNKKVSPKTILKRNINTFIVGLALQMYNFIKSKNNAFLILAVLSMAFSFYMLNGDPSPFKKLGDVCDEGYWIHNAKNKVLHDKFLVDELNQAYIGAPIYNWVSYASLTLFGVNSFAARVPVLLFYYAGIFLLYFSIKKTFGRKQAFLTAASLLMMHELLMQINWSTPIFFEIFFEIAVVVLLTIYDFNPRTDFLAGFCLSLVPASKLSGVYFLPAVFLFFLILFFIKKPVFYKKLIYFATGCTVSGILVFLLFYAGRLTELEFFNNTIGKVNIGQPCYTCFGDILFNKMFQYPGISFLFVLAFIALITGLETINNIGCRRFFAEKKLLELFMICWLVAGAATFEFLIDRSERRFVMFIYPVTFIAIQFFCNFKNITTDFKRIWFYTGIMIFVCFMYSWEWMANVFYLFFNYYIRDYFIDEHVYIFLIPCLPIIYFAIKNRLKPIFNYLLIASFFSSICLNGIWLASRTETLADANKMIAKAYPKPIISTGFFSHLLSYNNCFPVWYLKDSLRGEYGFMNKDFIKNDPQNKYVLFDSYVFEGLDGELILGPKKQQAHLNRSDYTNDEIIDSTRINLFPIPFTKEYRMKINMYTIKKEGH